MVKYLIWLLPYFLVLPGIGQNSKYRNAERFLGSNLQSVVKSIRVTPFMINQGNKFWYKYETSDGVRFYYVDPKAKKHQELFDRERVGRVLTELGHLPVDYKQISTSFSFLADHETIVFRVDTSCLNYHIFSGDIVVRGQKEQRVYEKELKQRYQKKEKKIQKEEAPRMAYSKWSGTYSPNGKYVVYAKNNNLYFFSEGDRKEVKLTSDGEKGYSFAKNETPDTAREVGANVFWWKDSRYFLVQRTDNRKVGNIYVLDYFNKFGIRLKEFPYVMAGDKYVPQEELYLYDTLTRELKRLPIEKWKDQKLTVYTVGNKSNIYFLRKKRTCDEVEFCRIKPETGEIKVLIHEECKPYFNDKFFRLELLNNGEEIVWWSERSGRGHYYLYDGEGRLKNAITSGNWTAGDFLKVDTNSRSLYFYGYGQQEGEMPYFKRLNKARLDGKKVTVLTPEMATHEVSFLKDGYFVDNYSRVDLEPRSVVRNDEGKEVVELASPDLERLYEMGWKMPEPFTVKAADGETDLYGYLWKPFDFDSTKTYPIISYVYPGPQTELIPLQFDPTGYWNTALAQVGFVVVTFGHRGGSPLRERWYHTYGYGNLRDYPLADDKYGIEQLADRYSFIDKNRVGICGHSGGGFMSVAALCTYPDFYTAAVASAGNHDNSIYHQWWGETHHGIKEIVDRQRKTVKNPQTGKDSVVIEEKVHFEFKVPNNMELVQNMKGYLMLAYGDADNNVLPANTLRLADALIDAGKNFELVVLPGQGHYYFGKSMDFFQRKMWFHFAKYLLRDFSCEDFNEIDGYMRLK